MYIYKLNFPNDSRIYIGITKNSLPERLADHVLKLRNGSHNRKLNAAFPQCGVPTIELLDTAKTYQEACVLEIEYISKYDSFNNGFNGNKGGFGGYISEGEDNPSAKYYKEDYACVLIMLALTDYTIKEISNETGVTIDVIRDISCSASHTYLKEEYPEEYSLMLLKNRRLNINLKAHLPDIKGPNGVVYKITSISNFARENGLNRSKLSAVINGTRKHTGGYTLC